MKTLYVRINLRMAAESFWRCAILFTRDWKKVSDLDAATAQRLEEEQMLEVSETRPADYPEDEQAGDSAVVSGLPAGGSEPPAPAPVKPTDTAALAEMIKAAVNAMDQEDPALWTGTGKPKTEAIAVITGWPVSAAERDDALRGA
ncbi:MAG: hypothetical protein WBK19_16300 [Azonexus sp.]